MTLNGPRLTLRRKTSSGWNNQETPAIGLLMETKFLSVNRLSPKNHNNSSSIMVWVSLWLQKKLSLIWLSPFKSKLVSNVSNLNQSGAACANRNNTILFQTWDSTWLLMSLENLKLLTCQRRAIWCTNKRMDKKDASFWSVHGNSQEWEQRVRKKNTGFLEHNSYKTITLFTISRTIKSVLSNPWLQEW